MKKRRCYTSIPNSPNPMQSVPIFSLFQTHRFETNQELTVTDFLPSSQFWLLLCFDRWYSLRSQLTGYNAKCILIWFTAFCSEWKYGFTSYVGCGINDGRHPLHDKMVWTKDKFCECDYCVFWSIEQYEWEYGIILLCICLLGLWNSLFGVIF